jgi:hypothetical protein
VVLSARILAAVLASIPIALGAGPAAADPPAARSPIPAPIVLLPTAILDAGGPRPVIPSDTDLGPLARGLDALLADTAADLGLAVAPPRPEALKALGDAGLSRSARAARAAVVLPSLRAAEGGDVELRVALASPSGAAVAIRTARVRRADLSLRGVVLLRDLVAGRAAAAPEGAPAPAPSARAKLAGRVTLMANSAAFGGLLGYSIQRGSGSDDPTLLVPLTIVGMGVGLGAAYLASGEWEVGTGDAWYFAAGVWWPTAAAHLIFQGRFAATRADSDRWVFGVLGGGVGATIATLGLALHPMSDGGAILAHGGGALGLGVGALVQLGATRDVHQVPFSGMGYGAALGWLAAAAVATQVRLDWPYAVSKKMAGVPLAGVIGESAAGSAGSRSAPILGFGYAGALD